ncbi:PadR family transcriptional regulator [Baekduia sp. Peel2402]|uniref:PadR family transcriptional regulator n=1 Tax=Baekduia sp. Peel2402 TaxID=3458296 RepID=UPI00403EA973
MQLTPTSYIVLGLLEAADGEATPYDLKQLMAVSVDNFWSTPHAQVYREPERLAAGGLVTERREETGRRRRFYAIADAGRAALTAWRETAPDDLPELRDAGVLKLFFGADPATVATHQIATHEAKLAEYRELRDNIAGHVPPGQLLALDVGIAHEQAMIDIWTARCLPTSGPRA